MIKNPSIKTIDCFVGEIAKHQHLYRFVAASAGTSEPRHGPLLFTVRSSIEPAVNGVPLLRVPPQRRGALANRVEEDVLLLDVPPRERSRVPLPRRCCSDGGAVISTAGLETACAACAIRAGKEAQ